MKRKTKDNKGITLIVLIITIVIMLILVSVTTYTGLNTYKETEVEQFTNKMQLLQANVDDLISSSTAEELDNLDLQIPSTSEQTNAIAVAYKNGEVSTNTVESYKVFTEDDIKDILNVDDVSNDIMVNFDTREILDLYGIDYEGTTYYTQYLLPNGQTIYNGSNDKRQLDEFTLDVSANGINVTVTARGISTTNGTLRYKEKNTENSWKTITNYTDGNIDNTYKAVISKSGIYEFELKDNVESSNIMRKEVTITATNKPKTNNNLGQYNYALNSENWAYTQKEEEYYVWIPRFVYRTNEGNTEIKFIKGNSNITTDDMYVSEGWTVHEKFKSSDESNLTGLWVKVDSANQQNLNMKDLLDRSDITILEEI